MTCNNRRQVGGSRCVSGRLWADSGTVCPRGWRNDLMGDVYLNSPTSEGHIPY